MDVSVSASGAALSGTTSQTLSFVIARSVRDNPYSRHQTCQVFVPCRVMDQKPAPAFSRQTWQVSGDEAIQVVSYGSGHAPRQQSISEIGRASCREKR